MMNAQQTAQQAQGEYFMISLLVGFLIALIFRKRQSLYGVLGGVIAVSIWTAVGVFSETGSQLLSSGSAITITMLEILRNSITGVLGGACGAGIGKWLAKKFRKDPQSQQRQQQQKQQKVEGFEEITCAACNHLQAVFPNEQGPIKCDGCGRILTTRASVAP
jgi:ribosomal protein S27E